MDVRSRLEVYVVIADGHKIKSGGVCGDSRWTLDLFWSVCGGSRWTLNQT